MRKNAFEPNNNLGFLLAKAVQRWNELLYAKFCAAGFPDVRPAYGSILMPLFAEDGLHMGELGKRARLSKQTMTTLIDIMERRRLIGRKRDPHDARAFRICLTRRSRRFMKTAKKVLREMDREAKARLREEQIARLKDSLRTMTELGADKAEATSANLARRPKRSR